MNDRLTSLLSNVNQHSHFLRHICFKKSALKFREQGYVCGQRSRSHCWLRNQLVYFLFRFTSIGSGIPVIQLFQNFTVEIQGQGHDQAQNWWQHLRPSVQSIRPFFKFLLIYNKFHIWFKKIKVKVMAKMKLDGHIGASNSIQIFALSFVAIKLFLLRYSKFHTRPGKFKVRVTITIDQNVIRQFICQDHQIWKKMKRNPKSCSEVIVWGKVTDGGGGDSGGSILTGTTHTVTPIYQGD